LEFQVFKVREKSVKKKWTANLFAAQHPPRIFLNIVFISKYRSFQTIFFKIMTLHQKQVFEEWLKQRDEVLLVSPRPCFDSDWMTDWDEFQQKHPGQIHMHSTMLKLLKIFNLAGLGNCPAKLQWRTLFKIKFASIITEDGSDPDAVIDDKDTKQRLVRAICKLFGQNPNATDQRTQTLVPSPSDLAFIRQFAINLACSSTHPTKKQLLSYTTSLSKKAISIEHTMRHANFLGEFS
jgi:hypothetical protein